MECARPVEHQRLPGRTRTSQCRSSRQWERRYGHRPWSARSIRCSWQVNSLISIYPNLGLASCLTQAPRPVRHLVFQLQPSGSPGLRMGGIRVPPQTYKSRFTQKVNLRPGRWTACKKSTNPGPAGERRRATAERPLSRGRRPQRAPAAGLRGGSRPPARPRVMRPRARAGRRARGSEESAPGGNRTRGLRLERPLLFGSPKRTVDH